MKHRAVSLRQLSFLLIDNVTNYLHSWSVKTRFRSTIQYKKVNEILGFCDGTGKCVAFVFSFHAEISASIQLLQLHDPDCLSVFSLRLPCHELTVLDCDICSAIVYYIYQVGNIP